MKSADPTALTAIDTGSGPWPLHDTAASRKAEAAALSAGTSPSPMERAGLAVARLALALAPHADRIDVWAGPGHNGGDGLIAARRLQAAGKSVALRLVGDPDRLPLAAAAAWKAALDSGVQQVSPDTASRAPALTIDALLGLGSNRAPKGAMAAAVRAIHAVGGPVLAVDIPSGLHPDTGRLLGDVAVKATATLSLLTLKPGCFTAQGRDHAGRVWLDTLGFGTVPPTARLTGPPCETRRLHDSHKGRFGDVAVVGGTRGMVGAAWLAARSASAAGAGRVFCSPLDPDADLYDAGFPELMARAAWSHSPAVELRGATVVCGCGGGSAVARALPPLLLHAPRLVLDADALNALSATAALRALLRKRQERGQSTLLTPHPLEAARLLRCGTADVQADRLRAAQALATLFDTGVLLKGSGSVIATPGALPWINSTGNGALATAGSGDVLAGWAGGLWAANPTADAATIACSAAWQHGHAADRWVARGFGSPLTASRLIAEMVDATAASPRTV